MSVEEEELSSTALAFAVTCLLAFLISIRIVKQFLAKPKRKSSCYLNTELKPQQAFKRVLADNSYSQFKHLKMGRDDDAYSDEFSNLHPYREEILELMKNPDLDFIEFLGGCEKEGLDMGSSSFMWVDTREHLIKLAEELENERVFAVDTEQHSLRSFLGFTALVQISTKGKDYLIDTIALHDEMGILKQAFANPGISKVFHGADNDILWLQRDFQIYVVNLFDTAKACDILAKPHRSLAYLLDAYCAVSTNKSLQREDWRQRPLTEEMLEYALTDAHYLLYIASCLCMELRLHNENLSPGDKFHSLLEASRRSNSSCMQLFVKDYEAFPGELAASSLIARVVSGQGNFSSSVGDNKFQELVRRLCLWRDVMARIHDESLRFVLHDTSIIALAAIAPTTETDICATISNTELDESMNLKPPESPSPVVCSHLDDLIYLLREEPVDLDSIFELCLQQRLGSSGSCPLSAYNCTLFSKSTMGLTKRFASLPNGFRSTKLVANKTSRDLFVQKFSCKSPVYHNCKIYANDGRLLSYCDRKKLEWYLNRNLAKLVEEDPPAIMLLFEPKGRPEDEDNVFYIQSKKNICVACGEGNHYLRYRIIPSCYRIHFPEHLKSHRSHDIVLLCCNCHEIAHAAAEKYKRQIAAEFGIPLFIQKVAEADNEQNICETSLLVDSKEIGMSPLQLRTAAMALLRHGPRMPCERREELMKVVVDYYGGREISEVDIERALMVGMSPHERRRFEKKRGFALKHLNMKETNSLKCADANETVPILNKTTHSFGASIMDTDNVDVASDANIPMHESKMSLLGHGLHGKQVVIHLLKEQGEDGIREFCQRWRRVFVEALRPQFLPAGWDVMHRGKREFGDFSVYNATVKAPPSTPPEH